MSLHYTSDPDSRVMTLVVSGKVTKEDYDAIMPQVQGFIDTHGTVSVLEVVESFAGFDPAIVLPGIKFDLQNLSKISRVAVVSDIGWFSPLIRAASALTAVEMRMFPMSGRAEAEVWLRSA